MISELELIDPIYVTKTSREKGLKSKGRVCCRCYSSDTNKNSSGIPIWYKYYNKKDDWDGESYLCGKCWLHDYYYNIQKFDPRSTNNIIKSMSAYKIGIGKYTNNGIGLITEAVIAKVRNIKIYCIESNNFNVKFDLLDPEQGRIQSKIRSPIYGDWKVRIDMVHNFDILYFICADKLMNSIKRVYIIPEEYIHDIRTVGIPGNPKPSIGSKYDKFRLDEDSEKIYNDMFHNIMLYINGKNKFTVEDITKWSKEM